MKQLHPIQNNRIIIFRIVVYSLSSDTVLTALLRLSPALFFGLCLGVERRLKGQPVGLRTLSMVTLSAAMLMVFSSLEADSARNGGRLLNLDPTRMAQGIMTGIGFLGAGLLVKESFTIRGITTASLVWTASAMGILFGSGFIDVGLLAGAFVFLVLAFAGFIERRLPFHNVMNLEAVVTMIPGRNAKIDLSEQIGVSGIKIIKVNETIDLSKKIARFSFYLSCYDEAGFEMLKEKLLDNAGEIGLVTMNFHFKNA